MSNPKESIFAVSFAQKLIEDQFNYPEEPIEPRPTVRERLTNLLRRREQAADPATPSGSALLTGAQHSAPQQ